MKLTIWISILSQACVLAACTQTLPPSATARNTITLCDENGCAERSRDYSTFDPSQRTPDETVETEQIAALEAIAEKDPSAAYDLGLRFFRGDGVKQNTHRSIQWMRSAAERGHFQAQKALGRLYLTGMGEMGSDPGEAEKWLSMTASRGDAEAQKLLNEAAPARQAVQSDYHWLQRWQSTFYDSWSYGYPYQWRWNAGRWYNYY